MDAGHHDVILTNILPRLDGPTLASLSCTSTTLLHLISSNSHQLWFNIVHDTWPSLINPRMRHIISSFPPDGFRSFFSQAYSPQLRSTHFQRCYRLTEFVSAVDVRYRGNVIFSKTAETTDTETSWFRFAPFRVDMLEEKDVIKTSTFKYPKTEDDACGQLSHDLTLSWIIIDPVNSRAANLSSVVPVTVQRHWLSGEVVVEFCSVRLEGEVSKMKKGFGCSGEMVKCGIRVRLGEAECGGEMEVREVSMVMEDMDGKHLNGEGSLIILDGVLEGKRGLKYDEFLDRKRLKKDKELKMEQTLDLCCVGLVVTLVSSCLMYFVIG